MTRTTMNSVQSPLIIAADGFDETYEISLCPETGRETIEYLDLVSEFEIRSIPEEVFDLFIMLQPLHFSKCHALQEGSLFHTETEGTNRIGLIRVPDEIFVSRTQLNRTA